MRGNVMEKMQELYEKVAKDELLQAKFNEIMRTAEKAGKEATAEKLMTFAKNAGSEATSEEIQAFFKNLAENQNGSLSDAELDMVAGGKSEGGTINVIASVLTLGVTCILASSMDAAHNDSLLTCGKLFE
jgi:hypothetical protein